MTGESHGGEEERLAPVIPLFGGRRPEEPVPSETPEAADRPRDDQSDADDAQSWHTTWRDLGSRPGERRPAPAPALEVRPDRATGVRFVELPEQQDDEPDADALREAAQERLVKALRRRSLSVSEARAKLRESELEREAIDEIVDRLVRLGVLDDRTLAEQLVYAGVERKNQGRRAIAQSLAARGIDRAVIDQVLAELPDDDFERALEYARGKAPQLLRYDDETALRRLAGQLARRGYGGLSMSAARAALDEARRPRSSVHFD